MKRGKSQYSLEFLITYGWAILIIGLIVGVIYSFGWIDPGNFLPQKCVFYGQVGCKDFYLSETELNLSLVNNFGTDLYIKGLTFYVDDTLINQTYDWSYSSGNLLPFKKSTFSIASLGFSPSNLIKKGDRVDGKVIVHFFSNITCGACYDHDVGSSGCSWDCLHNSSGRVLVKVSK